MRKGDRRTGQGGGGRRSTDKTDTGTRACSEIETLAGKTENHHEGEEADVARVVLTLRGALLLPTSTSEACRSLFNGGKSEVCCQNSPVSERSALRYKQRAPRCGLGIIASSRCDCIADGRSFWSLLLLFCCSG